MKCEDCGRECERDMAWESDKGEAWHCPQCGHFSVYVGSDEKALIPIELDAEQWDMVRCAMQSMASRFMENAEQDSGKDEKLAAMWHDLFNKAYDIARIVARSIGMDAEVW